MENFENRMVYLLYKRNPDYWESDILCGIYTKKAMEEILEDIYQKEVIAANDKIHQYEEEIIQKKKEYVVFFDKAQELVEAQKNAPTKEEQKAIRKERKGYIKQGNTIVNYVHSLQYKIENLKEKIENKSFDRSVYYFEDDYIRTSKEGYDVSSCDCD